VLVETYQQCRVRRAGFCLRCAGPARRGAHPHRGEVGLFQ
jgi:hypothetical protein